MRSFFCCLFSSIYRENLHIQYKHGKIRTRKKSVFGNFSRSVSNGEFPIYTRIKKYQMHDSYFDEIKIIEIPVAKI